MKIIKLTLTAFTILIIIAIAGCHHSKKSVITTSSKPATTNAITTTTVASTSAATATTRPNYFTPMPLSIIYKPASPELTAINVKYANVTLDQLQKGYTLYAESACIGCHRAFDIHPIEEPKWKDIIDDMSRKAHISDEQKNDVYMYVLSVKATQAK